MPIASPAPTPSAPSPVAAHAARSISVSRDIFRVPLITRPSAIAATVMLLGRHLLDDFEDLAPARDAVAPNAIEIGDQRFDFRGADQRLRLPDLGELVKGVMYRGIAPAPAAPAALRVENLDSPRQVIGRIPVVERPPILLVRNLGAHHEKAHDHRVPLSIRSMASGYACHVAPGYRFPSRIVEENLASPTG